MKYHFSEEVTTAIADILEPFTRSEEWKGLQVPGYEMPCGALLLVGKPGVGKTTIALELLKQVSGMAKGGITCLDMGKVGSEKLGQTEKSIRAAFDEAIAKCKSHSAVRRKSKVPVLFLDEIDALAWDRSKVTNSQMFMLSIVDILLIEIDTFMEKGGLVCMTTNHEDLLDPSLVRRVTDRICLTPPIGEDAMKVWHNLMPPSPFGYGFDLSNINDIIANLQWTPNQIAKWIFAEARKAFREHRTMSIKQLIK